MSTPDEPGLDFLAGQNLDGPLEAPESVSAAPPATAAAPSAPIAAEERLDALEATVEEIVDLLEKLTTPGEDGPWWWEGLDRESAAALWVELAEFVGYLSRRYGRNLPDSVGADIPGCWYRHPVAVELLTALMVSHKGAYLTGPREPGFHLVDYHERSLWPTFDRLRQLQVFKYCQEGHRTEAAGEWGAQRQTWEPDEEFGEFVAEALPSSPAEGSS